MNNFFENDVVWIPIFLILSVISHYYQKYLKKQHIKDKERLEEMKRNPEKFSEFEKNYQKHMIVGKDETVIGSLSLVKYLFALGAIFIFLQITGVIPPPTPYIQ